MWMKPTGEPKSPARQSVTQPLSNPCAITEKIPKKNSVSALNDYLSMTCTKRPVKREDLHRVPTKAFDKAILTLS
jgi:hypothetical protein